MASGVVGLAGVFLYLGSYALLQLGFIKGQSYVYASLNLLAACCVLFDLQSNFNLPSALIQISWIVISVIGMARLYIATRRVSFGPAEEALRVARLSTLPLPLARRFFDLGVWVEVRQGAVLTTEGTPVAELVYLHRGRASVSLGGHEVGFCGEGSFVGELTCLGGEPATATVVLSEPSFCFCVRADRLRQMAAREPELRRVLEAGFIGDARRKLSAANEDRRRASGLLEGSAAV